jgi:hypothetical protein
MLRPRDGGWELSGAARFTWEGMHCELEYIVACDVRWETRSARVVGAIGDRGVHLRLSANPERAWHVNGAECPAVAGCVDVDLGFSPSTNLIPIRRLSLAVGEQAEVRAAWLPFPSLACEPLDQVYRRAGDRTYRYEAGGGFVRTLEVNAVGFVTRYPGLWRAESAT